MKKISVLMVLIMVISNATAGILIESYSSPTDITNLAAADALIADINPTATSEPDFVDHFDNNGSIGNFSNNLLIPGVPGFTDNFALTAKCNLYIPTTGTYTFGTNNDDGARLRIDNVDVIVDDTLHAPADFFGAATLNKGIHQLSLVFFDFVGGASIELFAMPGTVGNTYKLIGDTINGGLLCDINLLFIDGFE